MTRTPAPPDLAAPPARAEIAFFGHNCADAAVRRRAVAMGRAGFDVLGFMPRRGARPADLPFELVDLGETADNAYARRIGAIFRGARLASAHAPRLRAAGLIVARNLDMLAMAVLVKRRLKLRAPLVYECLDIHHKLSGTGAVSRALRGLEARLLAHCALVVTSSPRFETEHFARYYPGQYRHFLVENRLVEGDAFGPRPTAPRAPETGRLRLGWFGNLRCRRSLELMKTLARAYPDSLQIVLRGYPALSVIPDLAAEIAEIPNLTYLGRYRAPQDLEAIYADVDAVWAGDWYETGANSLWLLPNRIYEGGYFATPALVPDDCQTGAWVAERGAGLTLAEPIEHNLIAAVGALIADPAPLIAAQARLIALPRATFVEPPDLMAALYDAAHQGATAP